MNYSEKYWQLEFARPLWRNSNEAKRWNITKIHAELISLWMLLLWWLRNSIRLNSNGKQKTVTNTNTLVIYPWKKGNTKMRNSFTWVCSTTVILISDNSTERNKWGIWVIWHSRVNRTGRIWKCGQRQHMSPAMADGVPDVKDYLKIHSARERMIGVNA